MQVTLCASYTSTESLGALCPAGHERWKPPEVSVALTSIYSPPSTGMFPFSKPSHLVQGRRNFQGGFGGGRRMGAPPCTSARTVLGSFLPKSNEIRDFNQWEGSLTFGPLSYIRWVVCVSWTKYLLLKGFHPSTTVCYFWSPASAWPGKLLSTKPRKKMTSSTHF